MEKEEERKIESNSVEDSFLCPSFSAYSSNALHHVADQLTQNDNRFGANDADDNFEFVLFRKVADAVFFDAASPAFPVFNRDLAPPPADGCSEAAAANQITLGKLLLDESPSSSSEASSEVEDELESLPPGTYCVWTPKPPQPPPTNRCKKSKSTGSSSSKRWKLLDLLRRSNSEGKESLVFLSPPPSLGLNSRKKRGESWKAEECGNSAAGKMIPAREKKVPAIPAVSAHEALYVRNREKRRVDKRRSYLPYRQDLVGFCVNLNAMGKSFPLQF